MTRIAFIGLGAASRQIHLTAARSVPGLRLVGGADPDATARAAFAKSTGDVPLFEDAQRLLKELAPDWALVGAPPSVHKEIVLQALEAGAHVFCEKPFVESASDADAIVDASKAAGRAVAVNHEFAVMPIHAALVDAATSSRYGRPLFLHAWQTVGLNPEDRVGWRSEGRTMREFGTHVVDLALRIFGAPARRVTARMPRPATGPGEGRDPIDLVTLEFEGGGSASIVLDRVSKGRHRYLELLLETERASLRSSLGGRMSLSAFVAARTRRPGLRFELARGGAAWLERGERRESLAKNPSDALAHATGVHLRDVLEAVSHGEEPPASARQAREVVRVVEAAYESARSDRTVSP